MLASLGALGVFLALFAETGLLIGFCPAHSLLFTAGLLCTTGSHPVHLSLPVGHPGRSSAALCSARSTGYYTEPKTDHPGPPHVPKPVVSPPVLVH